MGNTVTLSKAEHDALQAVVEAAQEWAKRDDRSCSHSDTQECVACEMEIYDLAQAIKPKLAALHSQASDEPRKGRITPIHELGIVALVEDEASDEGNEE